MSSIVDVLLANAIAFGIEVVLLILLSYVGLFAIIRVSERILKRPSLHIDPEKREAWFRRLRRSSRLLVASVGLLLLITNVAVSFLHINTLTALRETVASISPASLIGFGTALAKVLAIFITAFLLSWIVRRVVALARARLDRISILEGNLEEIHELLDRLKIFLKFLLLLSALLVSLLILGVSGPWLRASELFLYIILAFYASRLVVQIAHFIIDLMFRVSGLFTDVESPLKYLGSLQHLAPLTKRSVEYFVYVGAATWVFQRVDPESWFVHLGGIGIRIIAIFFFSRVLIEICTLFIYEFFLDGEGETAEVTRQDQQRQTLAPLVVSLLRYTIYFAALVMVMREAGINPTPLLAGAGVLGIAVGLGAQTLVTDVVSGFFILFEHLFLVGDFIECAGVSGYVEEIGVRITKIRDRSGVLHAIPNGEIRKIASHSREFVNAVVDVSIAYEVDIEKATLVLQELGEQLSREHPGVLAPTQVVGVLEFGESEIVLRTSTRVKPAMDFEVSNLLRRRVKEAFDREGIEIPYARRVLIFRQQEEGEAMHERSMDRPVEPTG